MGAPALEVFKTGLDGQHGVGGDRGLELGETLKVHFNPNQSVILQFYEYKEQMIIKQEEDGQVACH